MKKVNTGMVMVNCLFTAFTVDHLRFLDGAAKRGTCLVVMHPERECREILSALRCVNVVGSLDRNDALSWWNPEIDAGVLA